MCKQDRLVYYVWHWTKSKISYMSCLSQQDISSHFQHIPAWQRIGWNFMQTNEMCRKSCPILQISYMHEIQIFVQCGSCFTSSAPDYNSSITTTRLLLPLLEQLNFRSSRHKAHNFSGLNIMKSNPTYAYSQSTAAHFSCL